MNNYLTIALLILGIMYGNTQDKKYASFLPEGYVIFEEYFGDLNKDGIKDCILIIKNTNQKNVVINRFDKKVDRNRRGIIVLLKKDDDYYLLADKNYNCFSSENEDGGVYYPPELRIEEERGNLIVHFSHGRYGFWRYIFRFQNSKFELIGYDSSQNSGPVVNRELSINFLTKKKLIRENTNQNADGGDEIFKETWYKIKIDNLMQLFDIKDFDELDMHAY